MGKYSVEKWENIGILANTPEERKERVVDILNFALDFMLNEMPNTVTVKRILDGVTVYSTIYSDDLVKLDMIFIPIILRIVNVVDIRNKDVVNMYNHIRFDFFDYMKDLDKNSTTDWELHYVDMYSQKMIRQFQEK